MIVWILKLSTQSGHRESVMFYFSLVKVVKEKSPKK